MLSGNTHEVISVVCIIYPKIIVDGKPLQQVFHEITEVKFCDLTDGFIKAYIDTKIPSDKAGAYGIQADFGCTFIEKLNGDYWNVVGFPAFRFCEYLTKVYEEHWSN